MAKAFIYKIKVKDQELYKYYSTNNSANGGIKFFKLKYKELTKERDLVDIGDVKPSYYVAIKNQDLRLIGRLII